MNRLPKRLDTMAFKNKSPMLRARIITNYDMPSICRYKISTVPIKWTIVSTPPALI